MKNRRLFSMLCLAGFISVLSACASKSPAPVAEREVPKKAGAVVAVSSADADAYYTVKKGETLYGIALDRGLNYQDVAAWNNLSAPYTLQVGQQLRIKSPGAGSAVAVAQPVTAGASVESRSLDGSPVSSPPASSSSSAGGAKREPKAGKEPYSDEALARIQKPATVATAATPPAAATTPAPASGAASASDPKAADSKAAGDSADEVGWIWPANGKLIATYNETTNKGLDIAGKAGDPVIAAGSGKVMYSGSALRGYGNLIIIRHNDSYSSVYAHNQTLLVKEKQTVTRGQKIAEMGSTDTDQVKLHFEIRKQGKPLDPMKYLPPR
ncbi:MAG: peptidoglycan DD-metalloendopeptidase family protein [Betaproteobacteria bacterium]|nr:peptidoglycan DD-metalloendopeptidase family protein [Betaproteobacteria bacterium]